MGRNRNIDRDIDITTRKRIIKIKNKNISRGWDDESKWCGRELYYYNDNNTSNIVQVHE